MTEQECREKGGKCFKLESTNKLALTLCPECHHDNYAFNVLSGICTWCGFDINDKEKQ